MLFYQYEVNWLILLESFSVSFWYFEQIDMIFVDWYGAYCMFKNIKKIPEKQVSWIYQKTLLL